MYLRLFKKLHVLGYFSEQGKLSAVKKTKRWSPLHEGSFCNLNFSPSTSILLNFFFPFIDIRYFFCQVLQFSRTTVFLKKLKPLKKPLFQKRRWSCDFQPRKTPVAQKHRVISRQEKMAFSSPHVGLSWDSPPPTVSVRTDGRTDARTYVRTVTWLLRHNQNFSDR